MCFLLQLTVKASAHRTGQIAGLSGLSVTELLVTTAGPGYHYFRLGETPITWQRLAWLKWCTEDVNP